MMTSIRPRPPGSHQRCSLSSVVSRVGLRREMRTCVILRVAVYLTLLHCADSWLFHRCSPTNCRWGSWRKNTSCNTRCGATGRDLWSRSVAVRASCGGAACTGGNLERRPCNRICYNGGIPMYGYCKCASRYRGTCCDVCE